MTAKLVGISIVTALVLAAVGVVVFFFLVLGMNGMTERQAAPVFVGYFVLGCFTLLGSAAASAWGAGYVTRTAGWPLWVTGPLAVFVVSAAGGAVLFFGSIVLMIVMIETPKRPPARGSRVGLMRTVSPHTFERDAARGRRARPAAEGRPGSAFAAGYEGAFGGSICGDDFLEG